MKFTAGLVFALVWQVSVMDSAAAGLRDSTLAAPALKTQNYVGARVAVQPDGRVLLHGQGFSSLGGMNSGSLLRLNTDGSVDPELSFSRDYPSVFTLDLQANGQIIATATKNSFNGANQTLVLRLNGGGGIDNSFNAGSGANDNVRAITVQPNGKVLVGGLFTNFNGSPYRYVLRLNSNGSIDSSFAPLNFSNTGFGPDGVWATMVLQPDAKILVAGSFSAVNGQARPGLVRLNADGTLDATFVPSGFTILGGRPLRGLGLQSNGSIIIGGRLGLGADASPRPLIRLNSSGVADTGFVTPIIPGSIKDLRVMSDDRIVAVDDKVYRFNADGTADSGFAPPVVTDAATNNGPGLIFTVGLEPDGKVVFGGIFSFVGGVYRSGVARLNTDGSLDSFFPGRLQSEIFPENVAAQSDGKILVASDFTEVNGTPRPGLARLTPNGSLDAGFDPRTSLGTNSSVFGFALQSAGRILVYGNFEIYTNKFGFARLNSDGTLDNTFQTGAGSVTGLANVLPQPDGKLLFYAGDQAQSIVNIPTNSIRRATVDGAIDASFALDSALSQNLVRRDANTNLVLIYAIAARPLQVLSNGKIITGSFDTNGNFKLVRLNSNGSIDPGFVQGQITGSGFLPDFPVVSDPFLGGAPVQVQTLRPRLAGVLQVKEQVDGRLLVVGEFSAYNGALKNGIVRLNADGSTDNSFFTGNGAQWVTTPPIGPTRPRIESVANLVDGRILISGNFEAINGIVAPGIARLFANGVVDASFNSGIERRDFGPFALARSQLLAQPDGNYLVTGQFAPVGQPDASMLTRLFLQPAPVPPNLTGWWPGDGPVDLVGGHPLSPQNGAGFAAGLVNQAFSLNGISQYFSAAPSSMWAFGTNEFTLDMWANFSSPGGSQALMSCDAGPGNNNKWVFWLNGGVLQFHINGSSGSTLIGGAPFSPVPGLWYHLALTRQASTYTFYINGTAVSTNSDSRSIPDPASPLMIGQAEGGYFFGGLLDEVDVFSRALTAPEIQSIYKANAAGKTQQGLCVPAPAGLVNWWPGEGNGLDVLNNNHGRLSNGVLFASGKVGQAFSFDGANSYVDISRDSPVGPYSLETWINFTGSSFSRGTYNTIVEFGNDSPWFGVRNDGSLQLYPIIQSAPLISVGSWTHVAYTWNGTNSLLYVNGVPVATNSSAPPVGGVGMGIGAHSGDTPWLGLIDEVSLYNRALTPGEIFGIFNSGVSGKCPPPAVPLSNPTVPYFTDFEGGIGTEWSQSVVDSSYPGVFSRFSGRFGNDAQTLTLTNLTVGQSYTVSFDLYVIDSWDGSSGSGDYFNVNVNGVPILHETFSNYNGDPPGQPQTFPGQPDSGRVELGFTSGYVDSIYRNIERSFIATNSTAQISFQGQNLEAIANESWGIDNVGVRLTSALQPTALQVTSLPATGSTNVVAIDHFSITENRDLLASSALNPANYILRSAGPNNIMGDGDDLIYPLTPIFSQGKTVSLTFTNSPLQPGSYHFQTGPGLLDRYTNSVAIYSNDFVVAAPLLGRIENTTNDLLQLATPLVPAEAPPGSGFNTALGIGTFSAIGDVDYWSFNANAGDHVTIRVEADSAGVYPRLRLRNNADGDLPSSAVDGDVSGVVQIQNYTIPGPGLYYIRVWSDSKPSSYQMRVDISQTVQLEVEGNDSLATANGLNLRFFAGSYQGSVAGTLTAGDTGDFYRIGTMNSGNTINLGVTLPATSTFKTNDLSVGVYLQGNPVPLVITTAGSLNYTVTADGIYYLGVQANANRSIRGQYLYNLAVTDLVAPNINAITLPSEGSTSSAIIDNFSITFSEDLNYQTVTNAANYELRSAGPDGIFGTGDDQIYATVNSTYTLGLTASYFIPDGPLQPGSYQFTIRTNLQDRAGNGLVANFVRSFSIASVTGFTSENRSNNSLFTATTLGALALSTPDGSFIAGANSPGALSNPWGIASGNLNAGKDLDLVLVNYGNSSVSVFLGAGDGTFINSTNYSVGANPRGVVLADLNGDGKLDIITANYYGQNVTVLFGNGDGTFSGATNFPVNSANPLALTVGDFNGDGKPDIATANENGANISVLLGNGTGGFSNAVTFAVGPAPQSITARDLNGDGKLDLLTVNANTSTMGVLLGNGDGTFMAVTNYPSGPYPRSVTAGDLNGDGKIDAVTVNANNNTLSVFFGAGDGTFSNAVTIPTGSSDPYQVLIADVNLDGKPDVLVANYSGSRVSVFLGNGDGTLQSPINYFISGNPIALTLGDFNGDGLPDIATANYGSATVGFLMGRPTKLVTESPDGSGIRTIAGRGNLSSTSDVDYWSFSGKAGDRVVVATDVPGNPAASQLFFDILYPSGDRLTYFYPDYTGWGQSAPFTLPADGTYYVAVSYNYQYFGEYRLRITLAPPPYQFETEPNNTLSQANGLSFSRSGNHQLAKALGYFSVNDSAGDYFALGNLSENTVVSLGVNTPGSSGISSVLEVYNAQGTRLAASDPGAANFAFTIPTNGNGAYYVHTYSAGPARAGAVTNRYLQFNGNNTYVNVGAWSPGTNWTVEAWVRPSALPSGRHTILGGFNSCLDWGITLQDGQFGVAIRPPGACSQTISSGVVPSVDTWYYVVGTSDGTNASIYVNGVLRSVGPVDINYQTYNGATFIGGEACCGGNGFPGLISDARVWNRALSAAEVAANMSASLSGNEPGLIGFWKLNEGSGSINLDSSSYGHPGVAVNGPVWTAVGTAGSASPGLFAQYLLNIDLGDLLPPYITSVSLPVEGSTNVFVYPYFGVGYSEDMSAVTVNGIGNYELRGAGPDGVFGSGDDELYTVVMNGGYGSGLSASYYISDGPLQPGRYRFTIGTNLQDRAGNGLASNYVRSFTVVGVGGFSGEKRGDGSLGSATLLGGMRGTNSDGSLVVGDGLVGVGPYPHFVAVGDLNGDGKVDMVVGSYGTNYAGVLLGDGKGGFVVGTNLPGINPIPVVMGDFNGDGKMDVAVGNYGSTNVYVYLGNGAGGFVGVSTNTTGSNPYSMVSGDFNGDGKLDLAVVNIGNGGNVSVLLGNGDGSFGGATNYVSGGSLPYAVGAGDFNGDGKLDLVLANVNSGNVSVLMGRGDGSFSNGVNYATGSTPRYLQTGDVNGDGKLDVVTINAGDNTVSVLLGRGDGGFSNQVSYGTGTSDAYFFGLGDMNGDGKLDVVAGGYGNNVVSVMMGNGDGSLQGGQLYGVGANPIAIGIGDVNNDGVKDIVVTRYTGASVQVIYGNGANELVEDPPGSGIRTAAGRGNLSSSGDVDYWSFSGKAGDRLVVASDTPGNPYTSGLFYDILNASGNRVSGNSYFYGDVYGWGQTPPITLPADGTYYVAVSHYWDYYGEYRLRVTLARPPYQLENEINNQISQANVPVLTLNGNHQSASVLGYLSVGDGAGDFYSLGNLAFGTTVSLGLRVPNASGVAAGMELYNGSGTFLTNAGAYQTNLIYAVTNAGSYYARVVPGEKGHGGGSTNYTLKLNGASQSVLVAPGVIPSSGDFTVEAWAYSAAPSTGYREIISQGTGGNAFYLGYTGGNNLRAGDGWQDIGVGYPFFGWHHFAIVKTSTNTTAYVDGLVVNVLNQPIPNPAANDPLRIGQQYSSYGEFWIGNIDDVRVWSIARTAAQIQSGMTNRLTGLESGLAGYWAFNEGSGTNVADLSTNLHNGTLQNNAGWAQDGNTIASPPGLFGQYILDFDLGDTTAPFITSDNLPLPGTTNLTILDRFTLGFSEDMLASTINNLGNYEIRNAGPDGIFETADDQLYTLASPGYAGGVSLGYYIADGPLQPGNYRITVRAGLKDRSGNPLIADYVRNFTLGNLSGFTFENRNNDSSATATSLSKTPLNLPDGSYLGTAGTNTGQNPYAIAAGLFNADGNVDLVTANFGSGDVTILLNNGDGTFRYRTNYNTGSGAIGVVVADFNADQKADLAVVNYFAGTVSILLGNGDGTFGSVSNYAVGIQPNDVVAGDLNNDGILDLVVANRTSSTFSILTGNGNGTFQNATNYPAGPGAARLAVGDLNGDGKPDFAIANYNNGSGSTVSVVLNGGGGSFVTTTNLPVGGGPYAVQMGDINGDGKADLVVANLNANSITTYLGNGDGTFRARSDFSTSISNPYWLMLTNLNGGTNLDLVVANFGNSTLAVFLGNGDGTFQPPAVYGTGSNPAAMVAADVNSDGRIDLVTANYGQSSLSVFLGNNIETLTENPVGSGIRSGFGRGNLGTQSDVDSWSFSALAGDRLVVAADNPGNPGASGLFYDIIQPDGRRLSYFYSDYNGSGQLDPTVIPMDGTYTVRISRYYDYFGEYRLRVTLARPPAQLEQENNGSVSTATPLTLTTNGSSRTGSVLGYIRYNGDLDYFNLGTLTNGSTVYLSTRLIGGSPLDPVVSIYDSNNGYIQEVGSGRPFDGVAEVNITQTGTYYAVVRDGQGTGSLLHQYILDTQVVPSGSVSFPNLQVTSLTLPVGPNIQSGQQVSFNFSVGNVGTAGTGNGTWTDRVLLSKNKVLGDADDIPLGIYVHTGGLAAGSNYTVNVTATLPEGVSGDYYLIVETDSGNAVLEFLLEGDNTTVSGDTFNIQLAPYPDLKVEGLTVNGPNGQNVVDVHWTTANRGTRALSSGFKERFSVRNLATGQQVANFERTVTNLLAVGSAVSGSASVTLLQSGTHQIVVTTDSQDQIFEYDAVSHASAEQNTVFTNYFVAVLNLPPVISIPPPQYTFEHTPLPLPQVGVTDADLAGGQLQVTLTVTNGILTMTNIQGLVFLDGTNQTSDMTFLGNQTAVSRALASLIYLGEEGFYGRDVLAISAMDPGTATDSKNLNILVQPIPPAITSISPNETVLSGSDVDFEVETTGSEPLAYQWRFNGNNIPAATNAFFSLNNVQVGNAGNYTVAVRNDGGSITSSVVHLTVNEALTITQQPADQIAVVGGTASFHVTATGTQPFAYQWYFNGTPISGANSAFLTLTNVQASQEGSYSVNVSNPVGTELSESAQLDISIPPTITRQPRNRNAQVGEFVSLAVAVNGTEPLYYQWLFNGGPISRATNATLLFTNAQLSLSGGYSVVVTNFAGSVTSIVAAVTIYQPLTITQQPVNQVVKRGDTVNFTVAATGSGPLSYQWYFEGTAIPNATNALFTLSNAQPSSDGSYSVDVSNPASSVRSDEAELLVTVAPVITTQPRSQVLISGDDADFEVTVSGSDPLNYQWRFQGTNILGATNAFFTITNAQPATNGGYSVVITNFAGSVTSIVASLTVNAPVTITTQPLNRSLVAGATLNLSVGATGTPPLGYQWTFNGVNIPNATNSSLAIPNVQVVNAGDYNVIVSNVVGAEDSDYATVAINVPLTIVRPPIGETVLQGENVLFDVIAVGTEPIKYQWRFNGTNILGATNNFLFLTNTQPSSAGAYSVQVSNLVNTVVSADAVLSVLIPPSVSALPPLQTATPGSTVTLSINASGPGPFTYQWLLNGVTIPDATNATLVITNIQPVNSGSYSVTVANSGGATTAGPLSLLVTTSPFLFADNFSNRLSTSLQTGSFAGSNTLATPEVSEPNHSPGQRPRKSVWMTWHATASGIAHFSTTGSGFDTVLAVYTGNQLASLQPVVADEDSGGYLTSSLIFYATAGVDYQIAIDGYGGSSGYIILNWLLELTPQQLPIVLVPPANHTELVGTPVTFFVVAQSPDANLLNYQWYFNGTALSGATLSNLTLLNLQITNAGDYTVRVGYTNSTGQIGIPFVERTATLQLTLIPSGDEGTNLVSSDKLVSSNGVSVSQLRLNSQNPKPDAGTSRGYSGAQVFSTRSAVKDPSEPNHCGIVGGASVWTTYTPASNGVLRLSTEGSDFDTILAAYTASDPNNFATFVSQACDNNSGADGRTSIINFSVTSGTTYYIVVDGVAGAKGTVVLSNSLAVAPTLTSQPSATNSVVTQGGTVQLTVGVTNTLAQTALSYQWRLNGFAIPGATNPTLVLSNVQATNSGDYSVVVTNFAGSTTSSAYHLVVNVPLSFTSTPQNQAASAGATVAFSATASGTAPLSYQWTRDGSTLSGATNTILTLTNVQGASAGTYAIRVSNAAGAITNAATLVISDPASISAQPQSQTVLAGNSASFTVTATGTAPLSYQWRLNGVNLAGATSASYTISNPQAADAGAYSVVVSNAVRSVTSSNATLTVNVPVTITGQPQSQTVVAGNAANFSVIAVGTTPMAFQWKFKGTNIAGATNSTLTIAATQSSNEGDYQAVVSNGAGAATSASAILSIGVPPSITQQPLTQTVTAGATVTFSVTATGSATLQYQWRFNGVDITGATNATLVLPGIAGSAAGNYTVYVSNPAGSALSSTAILTVNVPVSITQQPQSQTVGVGNTLTFSVAASGTAPIRYRWQFNNVDLPGKTNSTLVLTNIQSGSAGSYQVILTNIINSVTSNPAILTAVPLPVITAQPLSQTVNSGSTGVTFTVGASGSGLQYQWRYNGSDILNATNAAFTLANPQYVNRGTYQVVVANLAGTVFSSNAVLTVIPTDLRFISQSPTNGGFRLFLVGVNGQTVSLQASTNFVAWVTLTNFIFTADTFEFIDSEGTNLSKRFYRAVSLSGTRFTAQSLSNNALQLTLSGANGFSYDLQMSTNLVSWSTLTNFTFTNGVFQFSDPGITNSTRRFYRALKNP